MIRYQRDSTLDYFAQLKEKYPPLSREDERTAIARAKKGDQRQQDLLVLSNTGIVVNIAREYESTGVPIGDLIMAGQLGFPEAIERYDLRSKSRFMTYATFWIRSSIQQALTTEVGSVRASGNHLSDLSDIRRGRAYVEQQLGGHATPEQLCEAFGYTPERLQNALRLGGDISIHGTSEEAGLEETLSDEPSQLRQLEHSEQIAIVRKAVEQLEWKDREVAFIHFGLDGEEPRNATEVGKFYGVGKEMGSRFVRRMKANLKASIESFQ